MSRLHLVAASDDYLLELEVKRLCRLVDTELEAAEVVRLSDECRPEDLAVELCTPSLFTAQRIVVLEDVQPWLESPAPTAAANPSVQPGELTPLVHVLENGLDDDLALIMGAWCGRKPKGELVTVAEQHGDFRWLPVPAPPKPWEKLTLSNEQREVLRSVLAAHQGETTLTSDAEELLLERLGFAPRLLAAEMEKLRVAVGDSGCVEEGLVRQLVFPRERSLEVVRDAVLERDLQALLDLITAAARGFPINDWQGRRVEPASVAVILFAQISKLLEQLLYIHCVADAKLHAAMDPQKTRSPGWYNRIFKGALAADLERQLQASCPNPVCSGKKLPSTWTLGQLVQGGSRYPQTLLLNALAASGSVEHQMRGANGLNALSAWLARFCGEYNH